MVKEGKNSLVKGIIIGVLVPLIIIYSLAFLGFVNFEESGWFTPGLVIIGGAFLLIIAVKLTKGFLKI